MKRNLIILFGAVVLTFLIDITFAIEIGPLTWMVSLVVGFFSCFLCYHFQLKKIIDFIFLLVPLVALSLFIAFVNTDLFLFATPIIYLGLFVGSCAYICFRFDRKPAYKIILLSFILLFSVIFSIYLIPRYYMFLQTSIPQESNYAFTEDVVDLQGLPFDLEKVQGKTLLIAISTTHCAPCRKQEVELEELVRMYNDTSNLRLIHIIVENKQQNDLLEFLKLHPNLQPVYRATDKLMNHFNFDGVPNTLLVNKNGKVVWVHRGFPIASALPVYRQQLLVAIDACVNGSD